MLFLLFRYVEFSDNSMLKNVKYLQECIDIKNRPKRRSAKKTDHVHFYQRPSFFARSIYDIPAGIIRPSTVSLSAISLFLFDHWLFVLRGVNFWKKDYASLLFLCPSIHP